MFWLTKDTRKLSVTQQEALISCLLAIRKLCIAELLREKPWVGCHKPKQVMSCLPKQMSKDLLILLSDLEAALAEDPSNVAVKTELASLEKQTATPSSEASESYHYGAPIDKYYIG